jgi:hypothetical protein
METPTPEVDRRSQARGTPDRRRRGPRAYVPLTVEGLLERVRLGDRRGISVRDVAAMAGFSDGKVYDDIHVHGVLSADAIPSGSNPRRVRRSLLKVRCHEALRYLVTLGVVQPSEVPGAAKSTESRSSY